VTPRAARSLVVIVGSAAVFAGALFACASDDEDPVPPVVDAAPDAPLAFDAQTPDADADVPLGDVCGDATGLEPEAPWPMRGGCPKRAGVATGVGPQNATVKWSVPTPGGESSPVVGADRLVWFGTSEGDVVVVTPGGVVVAALRTGGPVRSSPARSASGLTVVGGSDGNLYAVDRFGGAPADAGADADVDGGGAEAGVQPARAVWKRMLAPMSSSPAIAADGTIYVASTDGKLSAVAADGSAVRWSATTNDTLGSSPALARDGTVYVGSSDRKVYAFTPDGATKWAFETGGAVLGSPVVGGDEAVYVGSSDGKLLALTPDGKLRWSYATGGPITGAPAVRGGTVYVGSDDKKLHAVSTVDGAARWAYETLGAVATPIVASNGTIYVGSADGRVYALTPSGLLFFAVNAKGRVRSAPALGDDGTLYVTTDTSLVAIGP